MHTFMQRVIPDTHFHVGGKFCLDLMALGKKLLGEYSKKVLGSCSQEIWKIIPTSTTSNLPGNGSPLKTQSSYLLIGGWDGMGCLNLTQQCSSGQTPVVPSSPSQGSSSPYWCTQQRWPPVLFSYLVHFEYLCKGTEVFGLGILLSCSYKSK